MLIFEKTHRFFGTSFELFCFFFLVSLVLEKTVTTAGAWKIVKKLFKSWQRNEQLTKSFLSQVKHELSQLSLSARPWIQFLTEIFYFFLTKFYLELKFWVSGFFFLDMACLCRQKQRSVNNVRSRSGTPSESRERREIFTIRQSSRLWRWRQVVIKIKRIWNWTNCTSGVWKNVNFIFRVHDHSVETKKRL